MSEQKVLVKYIDSALAAQNGVQAFPMGLRLALQYKEKGWIAGADEEARRVLESQKGLLAPKSVQREVVHGPDDSCLTQVSWVTNEFIDASARKIAERAGFKVIPFPATMLSSGLTMSVKFLLVESPLRGFTSNQLTNLRWLQFQRLVPYVMRIVGNSMSDEFKQCLIHSKLNIFASHKAFDQVMEVHEDIMQADWYIEDKNDYYTFWRKIDEVIKALPQPKPKVKKEKKFLVKPKEESPVPEEEVESAEERLRGVLTGEGAGKLELEDIENMAKELPLMYQKLPDEIILSNNEVLDTKTNKIKPRSLKRKP